MTMYALIGPQTNDVLTLNGAVLVHEDKSEMEFLFPKNRIVAFRPSTGDRVMRLRDHPDLQAVRFPLTKADFIRRQARS